MAGTIITGAFAVVLFCFVVWRKIKQNKKHKPSYKQKKSIEKLRQHESRIRGQVGGRGM